MPRDPRSDHPRRLYEDSVRNRCQRIFL